MVTADCRMYGARSAALISCVTCVDWKPGSMLPGFQSTQVTQEISAALRAPYILQSAVTIERQLPANTTLALTYTNSHGLHLFRSQDINAPLPGTYNPAVANSGLFPLGHPGPVELME